MNTEEKDEAGFFIWTNPAMIPLVIDGEETFRCPRRPIKEDPTGWSRLMFYYNLFKQGHLPDAGSISEQSFRAMNLFGFIGAYVEECQEKKQEDENARRRSGG